MPELPLFPQRASSMAGDVDLLFFAWLAISVFFSVLIAVAIFYFFVRFRQEREGAKGTPERASWPLEVTWSVIPLVIVLAMFGWGAKVFVDLRQPPEDAVEYYVTGKRWMWKVQHPSGTREINALHVPAGVPIRLKMISEDVIHSFFIPAFRIKQDVLPGRYTTLWFEASRPGRYHLFCAEYCGAEHSQMGGFVQVMEPADYEAWLAGRGPTSAPTESGEELFASRNCNTCHYTGSRARGPELNGLFGAEVRLADGSVVVADENYIRESIVNPATKIVAGYEPLMPTYKGQLSEEQLSELVAYIKSLPALTSETADEESARPTR